MATRPKVHLLLVVSFIAVALGVVGAQVKAPQLGVDPKTAALDQIIPVDPHITVGTLANGLHYYIRSNDQPQNRAELRLVVKAGSVLEDDDQQGLAHFVEHMAFNGSKHFAKNELIQFMESIGMRMGPSVNAFTSFDETVYILQIPTDRPDVLDKAFVALEDWAHNLTLDPSEIDKERGVIREEWRLGRGANARMQDVQFPILMKGSRYASRLPIGKMDVIGSFKYDRLKQFYTDWYRPDLMAVVAVGDFKTPQIESLIKQHFAPLQNPPNERPRPVYDVPDHPGTLYSVATDREATMTTVSVYNKLAAGEQMSVGSYRDMIVEQLYLSLLNYRLSDLTRQANPPFLAANAGHGLFVNTKEAATLSAAVRDGGVEPALEALFTEAARVARYGFTPTEFARQKQENLRQYEALYAERDKHESRTLAEEYIRNFVQGESIPGIAYEYELQKRFLPEITLAEVNKLATTWTADRSRVVLVNAPDRAGATLPTEAKLAAVINGIANKQITAYVDDAANASLLDAPPRGGTIVKTTTNERYGITEWQLSNGVKVVLKPTDFKSDEVVFQAFSFGGTSLASDADFIAARTAAQVVSMGGLGKFDLTTLRKVTSGKLAQVEPMISDTEQGLAGGGSPKDLETMFQLIFLTFTQPRVDPAMFANFTSQLKAMLTNQAASPSFTFNDVLQTTLTQNHLRGRPMTAEMVDQMNLEKSLAFYKERFADASDFTFLFVGSFDLATIKPFVETYLGGLPSTGRHQSWRNVGIKPPAGVVKKTVMKGIEPKSQVSIVFTGPFEYNAANRLALKIMSMTLQGKLRDSLREEMGGTYGVSVTSTTTKVPEQTYSINVSFGCDPGRADELVAAAWREIEDFKDMTLNERQMGEVRNQLLRDFETNIRDNDYVLSQLTERYMDQEDVRTLFEMPDAYRRLDGDAIQAAARRYLTSRNYVQLTLLPEKKAETAPNKIGARLRMPIPMLQPVPAF